MFSCIWQLLLMFHCPLFFNRGPLIRLTKKDQPFFWEVEIENAFQYLKVSSTTTPLLIHADPSKPFVL